MAHEPDHGQHATPPQIHREYDETITGIPMMLTKQCGHHCGVITVGSGASQAKHEKRCPCVECHNEPLTALVTATTGSSDGIDPSTIT